MIKTKNVCYSVVPRINPQKKDDAPKYYAQAQATGYMDLEEISQRMEKESTVSKADTMAVLTALESLIVEAVGQGQIVKLGNLGSFYLTLQSKGSMTEQDYDLKLLKRARINFRPGTALQKKLKTLTYTKVPKIANADETGNDDGESANGQGN